MLPSRNPEVGTEKDLLNGLHLGVQSREPSPPFCCFSVCGLGLSLSLPVVLLKLKILSCCKFKLMLISDSVEIT